MGEIVNLNKARKERDKAKAKIEAKHNRAANGRSLADKALEAAKKKLEQRRLDAAKLDPPKR